MAEVIAGPGVSLPMAAEVERPRTGGWSRGRRVGFRWLFSYVLLYALPFPLNLIPWGAGERIDGVFSSLWEAPVEAVAKWLFGLDVTAPVATGSGDGVFSYVQLLCVAVAASAATLLWSAFDRRRADYARLHEWLRAYVRLYLVSVMCAYGAIKIIKTQFPDPTPSRLTQPFGDASPMGLLWTFMGSSALYTAFAGAGEMLGGLLLMARRTTLFGALVCIGVMSNVVALNFSYDVPVKLFSLHLLAMAVLLAAPDARRLLDFLVRNRPVPAVELRPLLTGRVSHRVAAGLLTALMLGLAAWPLVDARREARRLALAAQGPLVGVWNVEELAFDGVVHPPLVTDGERWRRVIFDNSRIVAVQRMNDSRERYRYTLETTGPQSVLHLSPRFGPGPQADLRCSRPQPALLEVDGTVDGRHVHARLRRVELGELRLLTRGFHWINERPYNR